MWGLADVAQVLQHPACVGKGRMIGHGLVREPIPYVRSKGDCAAADEKDALEFCTATQLTLRFGMQTLDDLALRGPHQVRYIMVFAEQPYGAPLNRLFDRPFAHYFQVESTANTFGNLALHIQEPTTQRTR